MTKWIFEPHVAEQVFKDLVEENQIRVERNEWLNRENEVEIDDGEIVSLITLTEKSISEEFSWTPLKRAI